MAKSRPTTAAPRKRKRTARPKNERAQLKQLARAAAAFKKRYGEYDEVVDVSFGIKSKEQDSRREFPGLQEGKGKLAIIVYVKEKLEPSMLKRKGRLALPNKYKGFATDIVSLAVEEGLHGKLTGDDPDALADPLVGGVAIATFANGRAVELGTACLVVVKDGVEALLTCAHVLNLDAGTQVVQPAVDDSNMVVGIVGLKIPRIDAGLVMLNTPRTPQLKVILGQRGAGGQNRDVEIWDGDTTTLPSQTIVFKKGAKTEEPKGRVALFDRPSFPFEGTGNVGPVIQIEGIGGPFAVKGDSGAPVCHLRDDGTLVVLGMLVGISEPNFGYAVPIHIIKDRLTIVI